MTPDARNEAVVQLETARVEQERLTDMYRAALGTSSELRTYHRLRNVSDEVVARDARLKSLDQVFAGRVPS